MTMHVKDSGIIKETFPEVKDNGIIKPVKEGWAKDGGVWKQFFKRFIPPPSTIGQYWESQGGWYLGIYNGYYYVAAPKVDQITAYWKTSNTDTSGSWSTTDGAANTANITDSAHPAGEYCNDYTNEGFSDWFLPASFEYVYLLPFLGTPNIGDFASGKSQEMTLGRYWSSTQATAAGGLNTQAILRYSHSGGAINENKSKRSSYWVRPFRKILIP